MVMDSGLGKLSEIMSRTGIKFDDYYLNHGRGTLSVGHNHLDLSLLSPDSSSAQNSTPSSGLSHEGELVDDLFSDMALKYINQMLMEEDMDEQLSIYQETPALHEAEKSLYEVIGEKYPPSTDGAPFYEDHHAESPVENSNSQNSNRCGSSNTSSSNSNGSNLDSSWVSDVVEQQDPQYVDSVSTDYSAQPLLRSTIGVSSGTIKLDDEYPMEFLRVPKIFSESHLASQFRRGVEEANKFLPDSKSLIIDLESNGFSLPEKKTNKEDSKVVKLEKNDECDYSVSGLRGRKHPNQEDLETQEGRVNKQSAIYDNNIQEPSIFDMVLLCRKAFAGPASSTIEEWSKQISPPKGGVKDSKNGQTKGSNVSKGRGKKQDKRDVVDLRTLLITCAQSVATDDRRSAGELLKQIRQHSSPFGDGAERLAHYCANALEARLAGTGSQIYAGLAMKRTAADVLKAYHLYISSCPFKKMSHFFANQTILNAVEGKSRLHIVDFGIYYGFQWPCFLHRLSKRPGGPPKLRITGIELPQPGFRPLDRIEDTGRRLADYCHRFGIPFDYHPIACKWENVQPEDVEIHEDEVLVVNCLYRLKSLLDETVVVDSPRNILLNNIRKMNPDVFIHGIVNGAYNAPFFITRFKEVLFHYSALFDMLETTISREHPERILLEREIYGREALNVIACEGLERVERPETYKLWQVRNMRAGFEQIPLNADIMRRARNRVKECYHKEYVIDEDSQWMLQGWKGRIIHALSTWRPVADGIYTSGRERFVGA